MCLPVVAGIVSGIGSAMGALQSRAQSKANEALAKRQAQIETQTGAYQVGRLTDQLSTLSGSQRANTAANGLALTGSSADVIEDSALEGALDIQAIRWNSGVRADNLRYQAKIDAMNAKSAAIAAPIGFLAPVISGVAEYGSSFAGLGS